MTIGFGRVHSTYRESNKTMSISCSENAGELALSTLRYIRYAQATQGSKMMQTKEVAGIN